MREWAALSEDRCVDGERRESLRLSGGQLEDGRSEGLEERTWPGRSEQELKTDREQCRGLEMRGCGCREGLRSR